MVERQPRWFQVADLSIAIAYQQFDDFWIIRMVCELELR